MRTTLVLLAGFLTALIATTRLSARPVYRIDTSAASDLRIHVALDLNDVFSGSGTSVRLVSHSTPGAGTHFQIQDVQCEGVSVSADELGWSLPTGCRVARWTVVLPPLSSNDNVASDQQSVWYPSGWGVLSEPSSLLRIADWKESSEVSILDHGRWRRAADLPGQGSAPAYYIFGKPRSRRWGDQTLSLTFVSDDLAQVTSQIAPKRHLEALQYLRGIIPVPNKRGLSDLKVVWFGVSRDRGAMGGASGFDTILANYIRATDGPTEDEMVLSQVILLHEQFHQLVSAPLPLWANESLAHFYAFKAARQIEKRQAALNRVWARCCSGKVISELGLLAVQQEVHGGQPANYGLFYSKGAAFWSWLDLKLQADSHGKRSLDVVLPIILADGFDEQGMPSDRLRAALATIPAGDLQRHFDRYLKRPMP